MKLSTLRKALRRAAAMAMAAVAAVAMTGCDSIYDDEGDCSVRYRARFRYTKNILNADAFGPQVSEVTLYAYDEQGRPAGVTTAKRRLSTDNDFYLTLDLAPGRYDLLAWCDGEAKTPAPTAFEIGAAAQDAPLDQHSATLPLQHAEGSAPYSDRDITPLFHGMAASVTLPANAQGDIDLEPIYLTRDTKRISVLLQNVDGEPLDPALFVFEISSKSSVLSAQNQAVDTETFVYRPWSQKATTASFDQPDGRASEAISGVLAELTTARLFAGREQQLTVKNASTGEDIIRLPLIESLLLVKGNYDGDDSDQMFLDRHDEYTLMLFIGQGMNWAKAIIYINGWRVVPPQSIKI